MLVVPNHHVIVPRTTDASVRIADVADDPAMKRRAHIRRYELNNDIYVQLDFLPLSDQWLELYLDGYRIINPRYANFENVGIKYEEYNLGPNNTIRFANPQTGNLKVICDTLAYAPSEHLLNYQEAGVRIEFDNIQSYDVFEKHFNPSRYPIPALGLINSVIRIRVGDAHYAEPLVLAQPCHGFVRLTLDRKSLIYVPRPNFVGWDVFGYTLMSNHGQMGAPASITVRVGGDDQYYNYSAEFDGVTDHVSIRDFKYPSIGAIAGRKITFEFYFFTRAVANTKNYKVGVFGQYRQAGMPGKFAFYLQGTSTTSDQVFVVQYCIASVDFYGNPVFADYRVSSKRRLAQNRWHHIVVEVDATNPNQGIVVLFLDGYAEYNYYNDFTAHATLNGEYYLIGKVSDDNTTQLFNGYISNFRIINNELPYAGERIPIPRRTLANTANVVVLGIVNNIQSPESIQDMSDITRLQKIANVRVVAQGPFSPVILNSTSNELMHGDRVRISTKSDYICVDTRVDYAINVNISIGAVNQVTYSAIEPNLFIARVNQLEEIVSSGYDFTGNFIIDDIDIVDITIDTHTSPMTSRRRFDFYLPEYPLMIETFDVYSDVNGLVANIIATNDGFARDRVNFNHGTLTTLGAYNNSLGGYFAFNGTSDVITGQHQRPTNITGDITCEVWFRIQSASAVPVRILGKGTTGNLSYGLFYDTTNNTVTFMRERLTSNVAITWSPGTSILSQWRQVVGVTNGFDQKIYVNGIKQAAYTEFVEPSFENNLGYTIGSDGSLGYHNGQASIVRIYNRALDDNEVLVNFNQFKSRYGL